MALATDRASRDPISSADINGIAAAVNLGDTARDVLEINLKSQAGFVQDGNIDAALAQAKAQYAAIGAGNGVAYILPSGDFTSSAQILLGDRETLRARGSGQFGANYKSQATITSNFNGQAVLVTGAAGWSIEGITLKGDVSLASQDLLTFGTGSAMGTGLVRDVSVSQAGRDNIVLNFCLNTHFDRVRADLATRHNWNFSSQSNANVFTKCLARQANQWGIMYSGGVDNVFNDFTIESNARGAAALTGLTAVAATNLFTRSAHGFSAGDAVAFSVLTGGASITAGQTYYVISANLTANDFQVSTTVGGAALSIGTDVTVGTVTRVVGGLRVSGSYHSIITGIAPHFENNSLGTDLGVPILVDRKPSTSFMVSLSFIADDYTEANALLLDGGRFSSMGTLSNLTPNHAIIGSTHEGAMWLNPRRWGGGATADGDGSFVITDNSGESIVLGDGITGAKPGLMIGNDTILTRDTANTWRIETGDQLVHDGAAGTTILKLSRATGDSQAQHYDRVDGTRVYGPGSGTQDSSFGRAGANLMSVDTADLRVNAVGRGLRVKEGSNAKQGTAVLVAGTVTVANTAVTANSRILITSQVDGGTPGFLRVSARVAGTSFTITSSSGTDTSTVAYQIFEPA